MAEELIPIVVVSVFFWCIAFVTRTLSDNRVKRELINMKAEPEVIEQLTLRKPPADHESSLKWGLVIAALGVAFATIHVLRLDGDEAMTYALLFMFGGGALLAHYVLKSRELVD